MKSPSFEIQIPSKCTVSESNFRPDEKGDWCLSCRKTVVDFTAMSDADIIRFFQDKPAEAQICGTFRNEQLNKPFQMAPVSQPASGWWPVLLGSFLSVLSVGKISAQATDPMTWQPVPTETNSFQEPAPEMAEKKSPVRKEVSEKKEEVMPGFRKIRIRLKLKYGSKTLSSENLEGICKETSESFTLDKNGFATLTIPDSTEKYTLTIQLKPRGFRGYRTQMLTVIPDKQNYKVKSQVFVNHKVYSRGFMVRDYRYRRPSTWQKIKAFLNLEPPRYGR